MSAPEWHGYADGANGDDPYTAAARSYDETHATSDANADALLKDLKQFMIKENFAAGSNMDVASSKCEDSLLVDEKDRRRKNVDSGKVAIIMATDSHACFKEKWSGTSKERRRAILKELEDLERDLDSTGPRRMKVKTIFIETTLTREELVEEVLAQRVARDARNGRVREDEIEAMMEGSLPPLAAAESEGRGDARSASTEEEDDEDGNCQGGGCRIS